jgi:hypothetical protein
MFRSFNQPWQFLEDRVGFARDAGDDLARRSDVLNY